jgi:DNA topoisomerase-3
MRRVVGRCPRCGADVVEGKRAFSCSRWKADGCSFYIWKTVAGRRVTAAEASALLERGRTRLLRGFRSKKGRRFAAFLVLEDGKVRFAFPEH